MHAHVPYPVLMACSPPSQRCRGTVNISDVLTDATSLPIEVMLDGQHGFLHEGMLRAAGAVLPRVRVGGVVRGRVPVWQGVAWRRVLAGTRAQSGRFLEPSRGIRLGVYSQYSGAGWICLGVGALCKHFSQQKLLTCWGGGASPGAGCTG